MGQKEQINPGILITRYLSGETSQNEVEKLQRWISDSEDNFNYFLQLKNIWDNSENTSIYDKIDAENAFKYVNKQLTFRSSSMNVWGYWKRIAAVLLIPLLLGNILYFISRSHADSTTSDPVYNELYAAFGTRSALKLSDGTLVWLNSGSSIKYPDRFKGKERIVNLNGEAYFEVKSDPKKPFIVKSGRVNTIALGTKFNVSDYKTSDLSEVTLVEGKVEVNQADSSKTKKHLTTLRPGQHFSYNNVTGDTTFRNEDTYKYFAWKDGKIIFRNEPLSRVVQKIGQIYNVDIELKGHEIENYIYRATFQDESLEEILKLLKVSSPINYFEAKRIPLPDGSFPRKKITIIFSNQSL